MTKILSKSLVNKECSFHFLFCNSIVDPDAITRKACIGKFQSFCRANKVIVYKLRKTGNDLNFVPLETETANANSANNRKAKADQAIIPKMISFIFELDYLNKF